MEPGTLKRAREYNGREEDTQGMRCAFCQKRGGSWTQGYYPGLHGDACSAIVGLQDDLEKESMRGSTEFYRLDNGSKFGLGSLAWLSDVNDFIGPWNVPDRGDVYIHQSCAVWSPQIYSDPKTNELLNVRLEIQRSLYIRCSHCRLSGASIGCHNTNCSRSFHLPCAKEASCFMDYENYRLLCVKCMNQAFDQRYYDLWNVLRQKKKREFSQLEKYEILKGFRPVDAKILAESALLTSASASSESSAFHFGASLPLPGLEFVYLQLKESVVIPLLYPVLYSRLNVKPFRGVLLHGPSGCGKTSIVREFAKFCQSFKDKKISSITFLRKTFPL